MQSLSQSQRLLQKLSPQQIQLMKLLQLPTLQLEERVKEEMEENPALEFSADDPDDLSLNERSNEEIEAELSAQEGEEELDGSQEEYDNIDLNEYIKEGDDEDADYNFQRDAYSSDEEASPAYQPRFETGFYDHLLAQLNMLNLNEEQHRLGEFLIGSIDEDGYLRRDIPSIKDDLAFRQNVIAEDEDIMKVLKLIQEFEPIGVGATNLQECLLIQLKKKEKSDCVLHAIKILEKFFDEFIKKHYEKIQRMMNLSDDDLRDVIHVIIKLNPKPGTLYSGGSAAETYVLTDFTVINQNGKLEIQLNQRNAPDLRVSSSFRDMLFDYNKSEKKDSRQKDAILFIKQKIDSAKWFIDAIKQRQQTLMQTMTRIVQLQEEFFTTGDESNLRPMILKDVSDRTGLDISTISRVVNSKYVQTEFGTYKLKYFFSESLSTDSGDEVSTREVKKILDDLISSEDKKTPLSDERLMEMLNEKGYNIARRTVAKYREQMNIPVARLRKTL